VKRLTITAIEVVGDEIVVRTVTETKRWWHRKIHYSARVYKGDYGNWRVAATGRRPAKGIWMILDKAYLDLVSAGPHDRDAQYDPRGFTLGEVRNVSRPTGA
jgi:hypothetical protein